MAGGVWSLFMLGAVVVDVVVVGGVWSLFTLGAVVADVVAGGEFGLCSC